MANKFPTGKQHDQVRSDSADIQLLANDGFQDLLNDIPFAFGAVGQPASKHMELAQNHELFSNVPFSHYGTLAQNPGGSGNQIGIFWGPPDVPSSLLTSLLSSTGSDTLEQQTTDQSVLDPSPISVDGYGHANYYDNNSWDPNYHSLVPQLLQTGESPALVTTIQSQTVADCQIPAVGQKRKRSTGSPTNEEDNAKLHERRSDLRLLFKYFKNPSMKDLKNIAKDTGSSFEFVVDSFLQQMGQSKPDTGPCSRFASTSQSISRCENVEKSTDIVCQIGKTEDSSITELGIKRTKSTENSRTKVRKVAGGDTKNKSYRCSTCSKAFARQADLRRYLRIHFPSDLHCPYPGCSKAFNRKDKMDDHWRRNHEGRPISNKPNQRDEGPDRDPDSGGPRDPFDRSKSLPGSKPPPSPPNGSSSVPSRYPAQNSSSGVDDGLSSEADASCFMLKNQSSVEDPRKLAAAEVIRKLGQGGFGSVYEVSFSFGTGTETRRAFACKAIRIPKRRRGEAIDRAQNEIRTLQVLDHPQIIKLAGTFTLGDRIFINTLPVADCNLKEFLNKQSFPMTSQVKRQIWEGAKDLASALAYLHNYDTGGGFHGDIKPDNILVIHDVEGGSRTRFLLADFGSARIPPIASKISHGRQALTPKYCAPEWFKNEGERGPPSDIWSFGCILMQIVTYIHNKTMLDFETFRANCSELPRDWTYYEVLPVVNTWLRILSLSFANWARPLIRKEHMDMIAEMLLSNPEGRPSAVDVTSKMDTERDGTLLDDDTVRNIVNGKVFKQSQREPPPTKAVADSIVKCSGSIQPEDFQGWPTDFLTNTIRINIKPNSGKLSSLEHATDTLEEAFGTKLILNDANESSPEVEQDIRCTKTQTHMALSIERADESTENDSKGSSKDSASGVFSLDSSVTESFDTTLSVHVTLEHHRILPKPILRSETQKSKRKFGCRNGPLPPEVAEHAKQMRDVRACWPCRFVKVKCSLGTACERCLKPSLSLRICYRAPLQSYAASFLPNLVTSRFSESAIDDLIFRNSIGFTDNKFELRMSSGPAYPAMVLTVYEFVPSNPVILMLSYVENGSSNDCKKFSRSYAPPVGLFGPELSHLKHICLKHIKSVISQERDPGECTLGDTSIMSWKVFEAVNRYRKSSMKPEKNTSLLRKAVMLYAMQYFMSRIITFTNESAKKAVQHLRRPGPLQLADSPTLASKLLNLQIKQAMLTLLRDTTRKVLEELERVFLGPRTRSSWANAFCVHLILCICIEQVQVALDSTVVAALRNDPSCRLSRIDFCRQLDEEPYRVLVGLFHMAYKTDKAKSGKRTIGFNPIRNGLLANQEEGITQPMVNLVNDIKRIMTIHGEEIEEKSQNPSFDDGPDLLTQHMAFRKRNSGRLVSKFLLSFM